MFSRVFSKCLELRLKFLRSKSQVCLQNTQLICLIGMKPHKVINNKYLPGTTGVAAFGATWGLGVWATFLAAGEALAFGVCFGAAFGVGGLALGVGFPTTGLGVAALPGVFTGVGALAFIGVGALDFTGVAALPFGVLVGVAFTWATTAGLFLVGVCAYKEMVHITLRHRRGGGLCNHVRLKEKCFVSGCFSWKNYLSRHSAIKLIFSQTQWTNTIKSIQEMWWVWKISRSQKKNQTSSTFKPFYNYCTNYLLTREKSVHQFRYFLLMNTYN